MYRTFRIQRRTIGILGLCLYMAITANGQSEYIIESPKDIPIACEVDIVVIGGSSGAVACACEAARQGASVFLIAPRPYLGTDICAMLRLWLEEDERPMSKLAVACFRENHFTTPYAVKAAMDRALLDAGVSYLTGCYATDVLRDKDGQITGVVTANRSGRQAVRAKVVVDATERSFVARLAGATFRPFVPGPKTFRRVVIGGPMRRGEKMSGERKEFTCEFEAKGTKHRLPVYEYTLRIDLQDNNLRSFLHVENLARNMTYTKDSEVSSERLYYVPSDTIIGEGHLNEWLGASKAKLDPFRAKGIARLYILNAYADMDGMAGEKFLRPLELMAMGRRIGRAAAEEATELPSVQDAYFPEMNVAGRIKVVIGEDLDGIRSMELGTIHTGRRALPVLGRYDVVVVGGGTSGAPVGIAAARDGAKTLVVEYLHELGGVGTVGLIGSYWRGLRRGFTVYIDEQTNTREGAWNVVEKAEWFRRELLNSGAEVWFGTLGCGAVVDHMQVRGIVVATPWGRGAVLAKVVVDATGNADIAACAGAPTQYSISEEGSLNVQIAGFPDRPIGNSYVNTAYTIVDDTDVVDVWHLMTWKRVTSGGKTTSFDVGQLVDSRERRRIVGDFILTTHDILNHRTFPDTISQHYSNFDAAAFPDAKLLLLADAKGPNYHTDLPYRCLLPEGLDGILLTGLGCSADRDAMTLIRMQADLQNQGYAAGVAAAEAVKIGGHTREIDIKTIQKKLIREGVLDERVYTDRDSYPISAQKIEEAIEALGKMTNSDNLLRSLAVIIAHPREATALLRSHYREAPHGAVRLKFAQVLAILGDPTGAATLIEAVDACEGWGEGVPLTSQRETGNTFSDLDRLVIALGYSHAPEALRPLISKLRQLKPGSELSHYKAISLALRPYLPCEAATGPLMEILKKPGFSGHATIYSLAPNKSRGKNGFIATSERLVTTAGNKSANGTNLNKVYKELIVASMLYRCGDRNGTAATILKQYSQDVHGHFARYAQRTLANNSDTQ